MNITGTRVRRLFGRLVRRSVATDRPSTATRVLVVDDDAVIRSLLLVTLSLEGFEVFEAAEGGEALETVTSIEPDVVILDATMPEISGVDVALRLHTEPTTTGIKVLLLSAHEADGDSPQRGMLGVHACLSKPFDPGELVAVVRRLSASA